MRGDAGFGDIQLHLEWATPSPPVGKGQDRGNSGVFLMGQFEMPYGVAGPPTMFTIPVLRYLKTYGLGEEDLAWVAVIQREWAAKNPRASFKDPITVEDVLTTATFTLEATNASKNDSATVTVEIEVVGFVQELRAFPAVFTGASADITVSEVRTSPDLKAATVFVLPLGGEGTDRLIAALGRAAPAVRALLAREVQLRFLPSLRFQPDRSFDNARRVEALLSDPVVARDLAAGSEPDGDEPDPEKRTEQDGA